MQSTKPINEKDTEETEINKTGKITNLAFVGIKVECTPGNIYIDQTRHFPVTSIKAKLFLCYIAMMQIKITTETLKDRTGM